MEYPVKKEHTLKLENFNKLTDLNKKLDFWNTQLPINYIQYQESQDSDTLAEFRSFDFEVEEDEREFLHKWFLANYLRLSDNLEKSYKLLDFEEMKASFELRLKESEDKKECIFNEQYFIDTSFVPFNGGQDRAFLGIGVSNAHFINRHFIADYQSYTEFKNYQKKPNYKAFRPYLSTTLKLANGVELAKYRLYLDELIKADIENNNKPSKELSLDQRLLILYYFGALEKIMKAGNNTKQGKFLSLLIRNDEHSVRQRFSSINDLFRPKEGAKKRKLLQDLTILQEMIEELGLQNIATKIKSDINKLKSSKDSSKL